MGHKKGNREGPGVQSPQRKKSLLSPREVEVLEFIVQGYSAKETAEMLSLSHRTIERHIDNARNKLGARNRPHLVSEAIETGLIRVRPD
jgi:LuxR family quorum sensing-dependent transcriptional regulator